MKLLSKGWSQERDYLAFNNRIMMILNIEFAKNKCLSTIWSTEKIPVVWTYPAREHFKNAIFMRFYNLTPTWFFGQFSCIHF